VTSWRNWIISRPQTSLNPPASSASEISNEGGWSLRARLLIFVTIALLPIAIVSVFQGIERAKADNANVHDRLVQSSQTLAADENNLLASAEQITRAVSSVAAVRTIQPNCDDVLKDALVGITYFGNLARIDQNGIVRCSALPMAKGLSVAAMPIFRQAKRSSGFVVSGELPSKVLRRPVIAGMLPLHGPGGRFNGTLAIALDAKWLNSLMRTHAISDGAVVFVYDSEKHILSSNNDVIAQALVLSIAPGQGMEVLRDGVDNHGEGWTFYQTPVRGGSIAVGFAMKKSALFGATYVSVAADFLTPVLMIILAWAAIWFATEQQVTRWISHLRRISGAYRGGHYSVRPRLDGAPREFVALGEDLSEMAQSIQDRDRRLRDAVEQKTILIREIHHRVKNNLQVVMSLLNLQASQVRDPSAREALMQAQIRISALALVHRILHEIEFQSTVDVGRVVHDLAHQIAEGMQGDDGFIRFDENIMSCNVSGDLAVPIALFVAEVLTNTFKHAFPPGRGGVISLALRQAGKEELRLTIDDDGAGFDSTIEMGGLGSRLIDLLAQQVNGTVTTCSVPGEGTHVALLFKDPSTQQSVANQSPE
jgi:two-component sensor histidine kinase